MAYYRTARSKVHARRECLEVKAVHEIYEIFDGELLIGEMCQHCTSAKPSLHVRCRKCGHKIVKPCRHNGGVAVEVDSKISWTWPEDVVPGTLVNPLVLR